MNKIRISAVSYLNTKPFLYGLQNSSSIVKNVKIALDIPSACAQKLKTGEADIGLIPVAVIPSLDVKVISDYCIGSVGAVKTVSIFSDVPIEDVQEIYLDYQSRTSVELAKILLNEYWQLKPIFVPGQEGYEKLIKGKTAGLIIGDRAINASGRFNFNYDLSEAWNDMTGLPFVFAAWVSRIPLSDKFIESFNAALESGIKSIDKISAEYVSDFPGFNVEDYLLNNISYEFDSFKKQGLEKFLNLVSGRKSSVTYHSAHLSGGN